MVSRDEIRRLLWPNGTVVEFVNSVNAAVKKLRTALGDLADQPRYIETVKGRGYRMMMPIHPLTTQRSDALTRDPGYESQSNGLPRGQPQDFAGQEILHYRVLGRIGAGGMGVVYRAEDTRLGREVALKFLTEELADQPLALERLRSEARSASALNHPNICTIYEIGEKTGTPFIAMELLEGSTLRDRISSPPLSLREIVEYSVQIAEGLASAHSKGIVHRDIKPANIFITKQGRVKILDFGLAKMMSAGGRELAAVVGAKHSGTGSEPVAGTVAHMSPEQVRGETLDARSDLFSFGVVLYEMVTGGTPFRGDTDAEVAEAILNRPPLAPIRVPPKSPARMERIIGRCLEKDCNQRYGKALEIHADLERLQQHIRPGPRRRILISVTAAAGLGAVAAAYLLLPRAPELTGRDSLVIADFINKTGDSVFDGTLREGLAVQLGQSPFLSVVPDDRIQNTLRLMSRSAGAPLTPKLAREICERVGSAAVLQGSIARLGTRYVLGLRASSCSTGAEIDNQQVEAFDKEGILTALSKIAVQFRSRAGESLTALRKHNTPLQEATTPSLEALKAYNSAGQMTFSAVTVAAVPLLKRAILIDPQFAMAHAMLGLTYSAMGESDLAEKSTAKAYLLRDRASERERFFISVIYDRAVTRNLERAQQTCELWEHTYPRDPNAPALASGFISQGVGNYERSIVEAKKAIALDPDHTFAYFNLTAAYLSLNRFDEAKQVCARFSERQIIFPEIVLLRYNIAFLQTDSAAMEQQATLAKGKPGAEDWLAHAQALVLARSGRTELAKAMSRRAIDVAQQSGQLETAATYEAATALWEAFFGDRAGAKRSAFSARDLSKGRDVEYASALALAVSGESAKARALTNDLEERFPEDTSVKFTYVPTLRAALALHTYAPATAIEALRAATPYELGMSGISFFGFFGGLYPAYLRGEAYLGLHREREAEIEF